MEQEKIKNTQLKNKPSELKNEISGPNSVWSFEVLSLIG
jgi:hypothetical protein